MPWTAVQDIDEHRTAFVRIDEGVFELRRIHTGERAGELVEVLNGLEAGEQVVTEGSFLLKGQLLRSTLGDAGH
jgi:cobalt-zinc-cadmium efflux system membrane fusion protein